MDSATMALYKVQQGGETSCFLERRDRSTESITSQVYKEAKNQLQLLDPQKDFSTLRCLASPIVFLGGLLTLVLIPVLVVTILAARIITGYSFKEMFARVFGLNSLCSSQEQRRSLEQQQKEKMQRYDLSVELKKEKVGKHSLYCLAPKQTRSDKKCVFICSTRDPCQKSFLYFARIAQKLGIPVYAFNYSRKSYCIDDWVSSAKEMVKHLLSSRPKEDVLLLGNCLGGSVASELAKQLNLSVVLDRSFSNIFDIGCYLVRFPLVGQFLSSLMKKWWSIDVVGNLQVVQKTRGLFHGIITQKADFVVPDMYGLRTHVTSNTATVRGQGVSRKSLLGRMKDAIDTHSRGLPPDVIAAHVQPWLENWVQ